MVLANTKVMMNVHTIAMTTETRNCSMQSGLMQMTPMIPHGPCETESTCTIVA